MKKEKFHLHKIQNVYLRRSITIAVLPLVLIVVVFVGPIDVLKNSLPQLFRTIKDTFVSMYLVIREGIVAAWLGEAEYVKRMKADRAEKIRQLIHRGR